MVTLFIDIQILHRVPISFLISPDILCYWFVLISYGGVSPRLKFASRPVCAECRAVVGGSSFSSSVIPSNIFTATQRAAAPGSISPLVGLRQCGEVTRKYCSNHDSWVLACSYSPSKVVPDVDASSKGHSGRARKGVSRKWDFLSHCPKKYAFDLLPVWQNFVVLSRVCFDAGVATGAGH